MKIVNEKPKIKIKRKEAKGYYRQKNRSKKKEQTKKQRIWLKY